MSRTAEGVFLALVARGRQFQTVELLVAHAFKLADAFEAECDKRDEAREQRRPNPPPRRP
jgi:hypothetical protein